ncbi:hypothetical protein [Glutamicibacter arilaitensis]|uniref:hypothetical protein n=1 Tax=Glutamicibacter arilaitensis TaxID=256701 RepID=UPI003FD5CB84
MTKRLSITFQEVKKVEFIIQNLGASVNDFSGYFKVILKNSSGQDISGESSLYYSKKHDHFYLPIRSVNARSYFQFPKIESSQLFCNLELTYIPDYCDAPIPEASFGKIILAGQDVNNYQRFEIQEGN